MSPESGRSRSDFLFAGRRLAPATSAFSRRPNLPVRVGIEYRFARMCFRVRWRAILGYRGAAHFKDSFPEHGSPAHAKIGIWIFANHSVLPSMKSVAEIRTQKMKRLAKGISTAHCDGRAVRAGCRADSRLLRFSFGQSARQPGRTSSRQFLRATPHRVDEIDVRISPASR